MRRSCALVTAHATVALAFVTSACSVDHRHLHAGQTTAGASSSDRGGDAGAQAEPSGGGQGGTTASGDLVDGCADLDTDGVGDCKTTLLTNSSFMTDTSDWLADDEVALSWDPINALSDAPSGSARLEGRVARSRAQQCVTVHGRLLAIAYANAFVSASADDVEFGQAELEVSFFLNSDCAGEPAGFFETPTTTAINTWSVVQAGSVAVDGTGSISVALVGLKPTTSSAVTVFFDNVMLKAQAL
jgi:hypothetical protein